MRVAPAPHGTLYLLNLQLNKIEFESKAVGTPGAWIPIGPTMGLSQGLLATSRLSSHRSKDFSMLSSSSVSGRGKRDEKHIAQKAIMDKAMAMEESLSSPIPFQPVKSEEEK